MVPRGVKRWENTPKFAGSVPATAGVEKPFPCPGHDGNTDTTPRLKKQYPLSGLMLHSCGV